MTDTRSVDVIILNWNDGDLLPKAIKSALTAADAAQVDVGVFVVDNASMDPPQLVDDARVRLVRNATNRGVAGGRNDALVNTSRPLVCFLDSDAELGPTSLASLLEPLELDQGIGMAVPIFVDQQPEASAGRAPTIAVKLARMRNHRSTYEAVNRDAAARWWDVEFGIGACQLFRRSCLDDVGLLDEALWWAEDLDFCLRLRNAGWRIVQIGTPQVLHPPRRRFRRPLSRNGLRHTYAMLRVVARHRLWR